MSPKRTQEILVVIGLMSLALAVPRAAAVSKLSRRVKKTNEHLEDLEDSDRATE